MKHSIRIMSATGLLALSLTVFGCASSPDVPEDSGDNAKSYRSTQEGESKESKNSESTSEESSAKATSSQSSSPQSSSTAGGGGGLPKATGPIAHVNGEPIPAKRFNDEIAKVSQSGKFPPRMLRHFQTRLVSRLIDRKLVKDAIAASSVEVSEKEVDAKLDEVRAEVKAASKESKGKKPKNLEALTAKLGITADELRDSLRESIAIEKLLVQRGLELPDEEAVRKHYDDNKSKFRRPPQVRVRHILTRVNPQAGEDEWKKKKKKSTAIRKEATAKDADFADVAKEKSDGPRARQGGDLGYASRKQMKRMDPAFAKTAFALNKGEVSKPVRTKYGWHIIKFVDRRDEKVVPFEKVKAKLHKKLKNKKVQGALKKLIKELRADAEIEKHPENIQ